MASVAKEMTIDLSARLPTSSTCPSCHRKPTDPRSTVFYAFHILIIKAKAGDIRHGLPVTGQTLLPKPDKSVAAVVRKVDSSIAFRHAHLLPSESVSFFPGLVKQLCLSLKSGSLGPSPDFALPATDWRRGSLWNLEVPISFSFWKHEFCYFVDEPI